MRKWLVALPALLLFLNMQAQPTRQHVITSSTQFNGYTNYWHDTYTDWNRYGSLFKLPTPDLMKTIAQSKLDVAEDIGLPGLDMQEGFLDFLLTHTYVVKEASRSADLQAAGNGSVSLYVIDASSPLGKTWDHPTHWRQDLGAHQLGAAGFRTLHAFLATVQGKTAAFLVGEDGAAAGDMLRLIEQTKNLLSQYKLYKGWMGAETLLKSVTCVQGHPLEVIGKGLNEGNSFFTFNGYMDFLMQQELAGWIQKSGLPLVADVGFSPLFGLKNYDGLQVQDMPGKKSWIDFAHNKGGYAFRQVYDPEADSLHLDYDGYIAGEGNKEQVDAENKPFITLTGSMEGDLVNSMLLFVDKNKTFDREAMWDAILHKQAVGVLDHAKMLGSDLYRQTAGLLYLDRAYLENYFGDLLSAEASMNGYELQLVLTNHDSRAQKTSWSLSLPVELKALGTSAGNLSLAPGERRVIHVRLQPLPDAMGKTNPVAARISWGSHTKAALTLLDLPPAISVHRLLYGEAPSVEYPVSIHNYTTQTSFPVKLEVLKQDDPAAVVYSVTRQMSVPQSRYGQMVFKLPLQAGHYQVRVQALGSSYQSQLGVGAGEGSVTLHEEDLNGDGINEYVLENDQVRVTLLRTGARVIEYYVKSRNDNVLFKLWPKKAIDDRRPFRKRGYYPYGGFEDFLGQGSMETHKLYSATVEKSSGDYVRVKMVADYFGNRLEKTFTLYGNSPLLEIRFALNFKNPEANVLGPQPILELGEKHGPEDLFIAPSTDGLKHFRMRMDEYYGNVIHLKEGWNAGYDEKQDIAYAGAYPVDQPLFLHMWMNHPRNPDAHHYYAEFQPWTPIIQHTTMYFSYYMWGAGGPWEDAVKALRNRNLITELK